MQRPRHHGPTGSRRVGPSDGGGDEGSRTPDLRIANATLYQLSYIPVVQGGEDNGWGACRKGGPAGTRLGPGVAPPDRPASRGLDL